MNKERENVEVIKIYFQSKIHQHLKFIILGSQDKSLINTATIRQGEEVFLNINQNSQNFMIQIFNEESCQPLGEYRFTKDYLLEEDNVLEQTEYYCRIMKEEIGSFLIIFDLIYKKGKFKRRVNASMMNMIFRTNLAIKNFKKCSKEAIAAYVKQEEDRLKKQEEIRMKSKKNKVKSNRFSSVEVINQKKILELHQRERSSLKSRCSSRQSIIYEKPSNFKCKKVPNNARSNYYENYVKTTTTEEQNTNHEILNSIKRLSEGEKQNNFLSCLRNDQRYWKKKKVSLKDEKSFMVSQKQQNFVETKNDQNSKIVYLDCISSSFEQTNKMYQNLIKKRDKNKQIK